MKHDRDAQFVALTMDVCQGLHTCLDLVNSADLADSDPGVHGRPPISQHESGVLLRMAMASSQMLAEAAEKRIEWLNTQAIKERESISPTRST